MLSGSRNGPKKEGKTKKKTKYNMTVGSASSAVFYLTRQPIGQHEEQRRLQRQLEHSTGRTGSTESGLTCSTEIPSTLFLFFTF